MEIRLVSTKHYAAYCSVARQTIWRRVKEGSLDYYVIVTAKGKDKKKWFALDAPNKRRFLDLGPTIL